VTPQTPEGSVISPQLLTPNTTYPPISFWSGQVGNTTTGNKSYYYFTAPSDNTYTITLYGLSADADLWVYKNHPFNFIDGPDCKSVNGGTTSEQCRITATTNDTLYIEVDGEFALSGATYSISVNTPQGWQACLGTLGSTCFSFDTGTTYDNSYWYTTTGFVSSTTISTDTSLGPVSSGPVPPWDIDCLPVDNGVAGSGCNIHSNLYISTTTSNGATSCVSYTFTTTLTNSFVSFNYKTNSTTDYDLLLFYIDNVRQLPAWSGSLGWQNVMFNTTTGTHTYKWCHSNSNTDASPPLATIGDVWVDNIYIQ
jgi:hypothetical protein